MGGWSSGIGSLEETFPVENPATAEVIEDVLRAGAVDVDPAVSVTSGVFEDVHLDYEAPCPIGTLMSGRVVVVEGRNEPS